MLAELQADSELAGTIGARGARGMSDEEQALFEELERELPASREDRAAAKPSRPRLAGPAPPRLTPIPEREIEPEPPTRLPTAP